MACLKAQEPATKAVEAAIKVMEDAEFTNAGIGSNLNEEGVVEGDANIVDHLGRSGACGAVAGSIPLRPPCVAIDPLSNPIPVQPSRSQKSYIPCARSSRELQKP